MAMSTAYLAAVSAHGASLITHVGLVSPGGTPLAGARQPTTFADNGSGLARPTTDETFAVAAGETVGGWRGYSALTGGTDYGGDDLVNEGPYGSAGTYTLTAAATGVNHQAGA